MKFICYVYYTALSVAIEKGNLEIIKLLLKHPNINVNSVMITFYYFIKFH